MNKKRLITLGLLLVGLFFIISISASVSYADSGWDSDYGGSSFGGSSSSSSSSSSSRSSRSGSSSFRAPIKRDYDEKKIPLVFISSIIVASLFILILGINYTTILLLIFNLILAKLIHYIGGILGFLTLFETILFILYTLYLALISLVLFYKKGLNPALFFLGVTSFLPEIEGYEPFLWAAVLLIFVIAFIGTRDIYSSEISKYTPLNYNDVPDSLIKDFLPNETIDSLKKKVYDIFYNVQIAWMNFDYDKLKELCSYELATSYISQLESLKLKNGQNIMSDFVINKNNLISISENVGIINIRYVLDVTFNDYVINTTNNKVTRGSKDKRINNIYLLTYQLDTKIKDNLIKCPNCGATIKPNKEGKCEYCHTVLNNINDKIVLVKKEKL